MTTLEIIQATKMENIKTTKDLAHFTAESVISKTFEASKGFPIEWGYKFTLNESKFIPDAKIKKEVESDLAKFNLTIIEHMTMKLDWLLMEGFIVEDEETYRILSEDEIESEVKSILAS